MNVKIKVGLDVGIFSMNSLTTRGERMWEEEGEKGGVTVNKAVGQQRVQLLPKVLSRTQWVFVCSVDFPQRGVHYCIQAKGQVKTDKACCSRIFLTWLHCCLSALLISPQVSPKPDWRGSSQKNLRADVCFSARVLFISLRCLCRKMPVGLTDVLSLSLPIC